MDLDVRKLRVLRELDERGTVAAVAEALHLTPSAVSQQLASLARETGVRLLEPQGRRVRLTGAARVLLYHADELFTQIEHARADLAAYAWGEVGEVRVTSFSTGITGLILPAVRRLRETRPRLEVRVHEADPPECFAQLTRGDVDLALAVETQSGPATGDARFARVPLLADPLDAALPTSHPLARAPSVRLADLAEEPWIFAPFGPCHDFTVTACAAAGFTPEFVHSTGEWPTVLALVEAGFGVALVPRLACADAVGGVVLRALEADQPRRHIFAATREGSQHAPHIAAMLAALEEVASLKRDDP